MPAALTPLGGPTPPVSLADALAHLYVTDPQAAPEVASKLAHAAADAERECGRSLAPRRYRLTLDGFPAGGGAVELPMPPAATVDSVRYYDAATGLLVTLGPAAYWAALAGEPGRILPRSPLYSYPRAPWPQADGRPESVLIEYTAGYPVGHCPPDLCAAVLMILDHRWRMRGGDESADRAIPAAARRVLLNRRAHLVA